MRHARRGREERCLAANLATCQQVESFTNLTAFAEGGERQDVTSVKLTRKSYTLSNARWLVEEGRHFKRAKPFNSSKTGSEYSII